MRRHASAMATVASVYTINPFILTPEQIVSTKESDQKIKSPKPIGKCVWASLTHQPEQVISEAFDETINSSLLLYYFSSRSPNSCLKVVLSL